MNEISNVTLAARGHWPVILPQLGITIPKRGQHGPCPACGGKDRFRLDDKEGRGTFICNQCGAGDGLDLVKLTTGKSSLEAAREVAAVLGMEGRQPDPEAAQRHQRKAQALASKEAAQQERQRHRAALRAESITHNTEPGPSAYLEQKGLTEWPFSVLSAGLVAVGGIDFTPGTLVLPLVNEAGDLVNVQLIDASGNKRFLPGGQKAGAYHLLAGQETEPVCVVEGLATGLSVQRLTQGPVYVAFDAGNLDGVTAIAQRQQPGKALIIAADHDRNGTGQRKATAAALAHGALIATPPEPGDWDDYRQAHGLAQAATAFQHSIKTAAGEPPGQKEDHPMNTAPELTVIEGGKDVLPPGFELGKDHLWFNEEVQRNGETDTRPVKVCSPLRVLAVTHDDSERNYGRLLEWHTTRGTRRRWPMPMTLLSGDGQQLREVLLNGGLSYIGPGKARALLMSYISQAQPERTVICVERTGWHGQAYVLPDASVGPEAEDVILQTASFAGNDFTTAGTLADWQREIGQYCPGNSRLTFAVACAFAAPLLRIVGMDGGGFHLAGESTDGKTTILLCAAAVCGGEGYEQTWRATGNALEGIAARRNDALLCLDELKEVDGKEAGKIAYMLANGQGKGRMSKDAALQSRRQWKLLFFSTGELGLADHAESAGQRSYAGMGVRMIEIPSYAGPYGAFELLHGFASSKAFADHLRDAVRQHHGTPFRAYLERLSQHTDRHGDEVRQQIRLIAAELTPEGSGNQLGRMADKFALVAAAGELATRLGITGWPEGEAIRAAKVCFRAWLSNRGHTGNQEDAAALEQVRKFFTAHQYRRFANKHDPQHYPDNMVGYRAVEGQGDNSRIVFYVLPTGWKEICKGFNPAKVAKLCAAEGWLIRPNNSTKLQHNGGIPGSNNAKHYRFNEQVIG